MIRVVLDTNIIVSALLQPLGPPAQVFVFAIGGSRDDPKRGYRPCNERNHGPIPEGRFLRLPVRLRAPTTSARRLGRILRYRECAVRSGRTTSSRSR